MSGVKKCDSKVVDSPKTKEQARACLTNEAWLGDLTEVPSAIALVLKMAAFDRAERLKWNKESGFDDFFDGVVPVPEATAATSSAPAKTATTASALAKTTTTTSAPAKTNAPAKTLAPAAAAAAAAAERNVPVLTASQSPPKAQLYAMPGGCGAEAFFPASATAHVS